MDPPPYNEPKYININGITQLNPKYNKPSSLQFPEYALPVISTMQDFSAYNEANLSNNLPEKPLTKNVQDAIFYLQDEQVMKSVGEHELLDSLLNVFAKYEIPIGLVSKLLELKRFDVLEFIIDDSSSMNNKTDSKNDHGRTMTRWEEVFYRLKSMFEILAFTETKSFRLRFLNRPSAIFKHENGESPQTFLFSTFSLFDEISAVPPAGGTPVYNSFQTSLVENSGKKVAIYFFGDGEPDYNTISLIETLIIYRINPIDNPITFLSCTGDDAQVEWMKELEEKAEYCAEYDDFNDESKEVLRDQGNFLAVQPQRLIFFFF
jgi:hypothetical protein